MGYANALDIAEMGDPEQAIVWHLQHNHFPPVPAEMAAPCLEAIDIALNDESWDEEVDLPAGITFRDQPTAPVWAIVEQHHLEAFLQAWGDLSS